MQGKHAAPPPFASGGDENKKTNTEPQTKAKGDATPVNTSQLWKPILNPSEVDHSLLAEFIGEAGEHLDSVDVQLLTLETDPDDTEAINAVFRVFHTLKGVAGFLGLEEISALSHETETLLDKIRKHEIELNTSILDVIFDCVDILKQLQPGWSNS